MPWRLPNSLQDLSAHTRVLLWLMPLLLLHAGHLHLSLLAVWLSLWAGWNHSESWLWRFLARPAGLLLVVAASAWVGPPKSVDFQVSVLLLLSAILYARPQPQAPVQLESVEGKASRAVGGSKPSNEVVSGMALTVAVFLTGSLFLLTQDLVLLFLACLWLIVFLVVAVVENFGVSLRDFRFRVGVLAWILGLSSLGAAVLFLLIPRIPMGLAGPIGFEQARAASGVSDRLDSKALGPVSLNAAADYAVRVMDGALPAQPYWRVHTLDRFIGGQWASRAPRNERGVGPGPSSSSKLLEFSSSGVRYSLQSLRALDQPPPTLDLSGSPPTLVGEALSKSLWEWAQADRRRYTSDEAWVASLLERFRSGFKYNLNAATSSASDPLAEFFFSTKQGYCSHFAATLAELLRANGIPVQLVTGYLGADFNASGNFYTLRQSQAHVWLEARLDGDSQVLRIDPTLGVPPAAGSLSPEIIQREFGGSSTGKLFLQYEQ